MAEVTAIRNNALPYPVYGVPWTVVFPILDNDGDLVTGAAGLDSEVSLNGDTAADCTNEATEIATSTGTYYLTLTAAEMTADIVCVRVKTSTTDAKTTVLVLYPRKLITLSTGTSQGGAAGYITLAASTVLFDGQFDGCVCVATIDTVVEARVLQVCTQSNQQCTVTPNWNTAPDADDTYVIYLPEGRRYPTANVKAISDDTTAADNCELMFDGTGYAGGSAKLAVNTTQIGGQSASASGAVTVGSYVGNATAALTVNASGHVTLADSSLVTAKLGTFALAKTTNITGFNDIAATSIVSGGAINTSGGNITGTVAGVAGTVATLDGVISTLASTHGAGSWATATGFSTHSASDVKTAMEVDGGKLDHLWEMTEDDGGVRRLTTNALEQSPTGSGGFTGDDRTKLEAVLVDTGTDIPATLTTILSGDHGVISIQDDIDTILARLVGTIASGTHSAQSGDSYAIVNGDHGLVSIQDDIDTILTRLVGTIASGTHSAQSGDAYSYLGTNLGSLGANLTAIMAMTGDTGITIAKALEMLAAFLAGIVTATSTGGVTTYTYKKRNGVTTSFTSSCSETDGTRAVTGTLS